MLGKGLTSVPFVIFFYNKHNLKLKNPIFHPVQWPSCCDLYTCCMNGSSGYPLLCFNSILQTSMVVYRQKSIILYLYKLCRYLRSTLCYVSFMDVILLHFGFRFFHCLVFSLLVKKIKNIIYIRYICISISTNKKQIPLTKHCFSAKFKLDYFSQNYFIFLSFSWMAEFSTIQTIIWTIF